MNYTGISCGWTWGYAPTATVGNRIEANHVHHINWNRILSDNGAIYTLGRQPGATIRGNHIHHVGRHGYGGWGIYPDEGSSEIRISENVVYRTDEAGFSTHYGRDNVVRNNIFALAADEPVNPGKRESHRTTVFERNIVMWNAGVLTKHNWRGSQYRFRENLFWCARGSVDFGGGLTLAQWQQAGQHAATVVADPLFADPQAGDFSLPPGSPAERIRFRPLDATLAGPRLRGSRPWRFEEWPFADEPEREIVITELELAAPDQMRIIFRNVGRLSASGEVALSGSPSRGVRFGRRRVAFRDLAPGGTTTQTVPLRLARNVTRFTVETTPRGQVLLPVLVSFDLPLTIPQLPPAAGAAGLGQLAHVPPTCLRQDDVVVATLRFAKAGQALALQARVTDRDIRQTADLWSGSCIEVFGSPASADYTQRRVCQLFLVPGTATQPPVAARQTPGGVQPAPGVLLDTRPTDDGYELSAVIPLELLTGQPDPSRFLLELALSATTVAGQAATRLQLFGVREAFRSALAYGTVLVQDAPSAP